MNEEKNFLENNPVIQKAVLWLKRVTIPGFRKQPLFFVGRFFVRSMFDDDLILRASSLAFNFFLALFPTFIFFFTLIAYIPIDYLHDEIIEQLRYVMPHNAYETMKSTITDILKNQRGDLLSFGFVAAVFFASNGFQSMMKAFEKYAPRREKRTWYFSRLRSIFLTFLVAAILIVSILVITYISITLAWLNEHKVLNANFYSFVLQAIEYISLFGLFYLIISSAYYFGSSKHAKWTFFNTGSIVATFLSLSTTLVFTYYVNQFNSYNKLYGSIGTLIGLMVLIYFNSIAVLIGFELNSSIDHAEKGDPKRQKKIA